MYTDREVNQSHVTPCPLGSVIDAFLPASLFSRRFMVAALSQALLGLSTKLAGKAGKDELTAKVRQQHRVELE